MAESSTQSTNRAPAVSARERARQVIARKRAAELAREKEIEESLATVLQAADAEQRAAARRHDAIAAAHATYDETMAKVSARSGQALHRMKQLGESVAALA